MSAKFIYRICVRLLFQLRNTTQVFHVHTFVIAQTSIKPIIKILQPNTHYLKGLVNLFRNIW